MGKQKQPPTPIRPQPSVGSSAFTPEQLEVAQQQAAQLLRTQHAVLKAKFADSAVAQAIAEGERDALVQRLQAALKIVEQLSVELEALRLAAADDAATSGPQPDTEPALSQEPVEESEQVPDLEPAPEPESAEAEAVSHALPADGVEDKDKEPGPHPEEA